MSEEQDVSSEVASVPERPKRIGLFRGGLSYQTLAVISVSCALIGLGSLGLEVAMMHITEMGPIGTAFGSPIPFISTPLGLGAALIAGLLVVKMPRVSPLPILGALAYFGLMIWLWSNL